MIHRNFDIQQKMLLKDTFQLGHRPSKENILKNIQFLCSYVRIYVQHILSYWVIIIFKESIQGQL